MTLVAGVRLGVDPGQARIGVAQSDPEGILATPTCTIANDSMAAQEIVRMAEDLGAREIVVGLPLNLSGQWTESTRNAVACARAIAELTSIPVSMIDERLTTRTAQHALRTSERSVKQGRSVIDQIAAVTLLQHALDSERSTGRRAGIPVDEIDEPHA